MWLDTDDLRCGNIDAAMTDAIRQCDVVLVMVTRSYIEKVQAGASQGLRRENCALEWNCAYAAQKLMMPVVMEPSMLDTSQWPVGVVMAHLGRYLYVDASGNDWNTAASDLDRMLRAHSLVPTGVRETTSASMRLGPPVRLPEIGVPRPPRTASHAFRTPPSASASRRCSSDAVQEGMDDPEMPTPRQTGFCLPLRCSSRSRAAAGAFVGAGGNGSMSIVSRLRVGIMAAHA